MVDLGRYWAIGKLTTSWMRPKERIVYFSSCFGRTSLAVWLDLLTYCVKRIAAIVFRQREGWTDLNSKDVLYAHEGC